MTALQSGTTNNSRLNSPASPTVRESCTASTVLREEHAGNERRNFSVRCLVDSALAAALRCAPVGVMEVGRWAQVIFGRADGGVQLSRSVANNEPRLLWPMTYGSLQQGKGGAAQRSAQRGLFVSSLGPFGDETRDFTPPSVSDGEPVLGKGVAADPL